MSYEPTNWQNGDIVTASKLNNIEQGIENLSEAEGTADKLLNKATADDAGKVLSINGEGKAVLVAGAQIYGSPLSANLASNMTETDRIYVYTGTETGYIKGNWYYYDGSNWMSGGIYNSQSGTIDTIVEDSTAPPTSGAVYNEFKKFIDLIYPVGSLYFSTSPTNPSTYLGGNWIRYAEGKTIFGASNTDIDFQNTEVNGTATEIKTGGSKITAYAVGGPNGHSHEVNAVYTENKRKHTIDRFVLSSDRLKDLRCNITTSSDGAYIIPGILVDDPNDNDISRDGTSYDGFVTTRYTDSKLGNYIEGYGSVFTANNLPPYVSCYIWLRIADNLSLVVEESNNDKYSIENVFSAYHDRVQTVRDAIIEEKNSSNNWSHAIFITDMHSNVEGDTITNYNHSQAIAMYLADNAGIDKIILGGDYCEGEWSEEKYKIYMNPFIEAGFVDKVYPLLGNHERMLPRCLERDTELPDSGFVAAQAKACICNDFLLSKENIVGNIEEGYYYIDEETSKTRFLFLNTSDHAKYSMSYNQLRWLKKVGIVGHENEDWTLLVFGHINLTNAELQIGDGVIDYTNSVEAKNGDEVEEILREWDGPIAGYICGHQHIDSTYTNDRFNYTTLYCDKFSSPSSNESYRSNKPTNRTGNSDTDSAVTVVSINTAQHLVYFRRIGAGAKKFAIGSASSGAEDQFVSYTYTLHVNP